MSQSLSNRDALVKELQEIAARYQSKPSTLLNELEYFLKVNALRNTDLKEYKPSKREPAWKVMGFKSKADMKAFEDRTDFPGWDAL